MQTQRSLTRPLHRPATGSFLVRVLAWLVAADSAYRQRQHLRRLDDAALRDVGLTRRDAETGGR
ncbi:DUF1127 domain-containing protein [Marinovum sp.]|uniref:DUF1127 domain-containing protein n=1 Tax=Marinovum sp. TaxID=2024839 RepID=UPI003A94B59B